MYTTTEETIACNPLTASTGHLSALEDVKNTVVEARTQRLNVSLVWIEDSSPPGARGPTEDPAMCLHVETDTRAVPRLWCDTLAKRA